MTTLAIIIVSFSAGALLAWAWAGMRFLKRSGPNVR